MLVIKVELWSAIDGAKTEIARMHIYNDGTSDNPRYGDYGGKTFKGRGAGALDRAAKKDTVSRTAEVKHYARQQLHVWNLVARMLTAMAYK